jgi:exonuclease III
LSVMSLYLPSGTNAEIGTQIHVYGWFSKLYYWIEEIPNLVICGDYNHEYEISMTLLEIKKHLVLPEEELG